METNARAVRVHAVVIDRPKINIIRTEKLGGKSCALCWLLLLGTDLFVFSFFFCFDHCDSFPDLGCYESFSIEKDQGTMPKMTGVDNTKPLKIATNSWKSLEKVIGFVNNQHLTSLLLHPPHVLRHGWGRSKFARFGQNSASWSVQRHFDEFRHARSCPIHRLFSHV